LEEGMIVEINVEKETKVFAVPENAANQSLGQCQVNIKLY
jgi:hypothetical protein